MKNQIISTFIFYISSIHILSATDCFPKDSAYLDLLGDWERVVLHNTNQVKYMINYTLLNDKIFLRYFYDNDMFEQDALLSECDSFYYLFSYTTYLEKYQLYITRYSDVRKFSISKDYDNVIYTYNRKDDPPWQYGFKYPKCLDCERLKEGYWKDLVDNDFPYIRDGFSKTIIAKNSFSTYDRWNGKLYANIYKRKHDDYLSSEKLYDFINKYLFFYTMTQSYEDKLQVKTLGELTKYYNSLESSSPYYNIKKKIMLLTNIVSKLNGVWMLERSGYECRFTIINNSYISSIGVFDNIPINQELFPYLLDSYNDDNLKNPDFPPEKFKNSLFFIYYNFHKKLGDIELKFKNDFFFDMGDSIMLTNQYITLTLKEEVDRAFLFEGRMKKEDSVNKKIKNVPISVKLVINKDYSEIKTYIKKEEKWTLFSTMKKIGASKIQTIPSH